ncbi:hypothetical protein Q0601_10510 [Paracoccus onubensis]|uniref:hypothetical protein n=1 Tax=Paracoccus onubensis TaxID=1675788 RepID=UPI002730BBFF|nr:hypothetical protein [Paracoccus onubensis]MDP0927605.1 hypothetical protein [Paracoccus onubensis]
MVNLDISYESNVEFGQIIQKCGCADAVVMVEPSHERDAAPIPFAATLRRMGRDSALEDSGGEVEIWQTKKHGINIYNLDVRPHTGSSHHDYRDIPLDASFRHDVPFQGNQTAFVRVKISRKASMIYDIPYDFHIEDDHTASEYPTWYESETMAKLTNDRPAWPQYIKASAARFSVPEILILSIAVMETTHGWYDAIFQPFGGNKTIRPMNINVPYWSKLFSEDDMNNPAKNFDAGAFMLKRIIERLTVNDRTIRKISTLYNDIDAKVVTDYGARVEDFMNTLREDWIPSPPHPERHR